jgi:predicted dehydrogenase
MELGCDAITEKPMTIDVEKTRAIFDAIERTGRQLRVSFNYRYSPAYTRLRDIIMRGTIGRPLSVDFSWLLNTYHGADYFRRWHREKHNSGGLMVHKATHHFDLVNWWIDSYPSEVFAFGDLMFYGRDNAEARGEKYTYTRYTGEPDAKDDPALFPIAMSRCAGYIRMFEAERYIRDKNVFENRSPRGHDGCHGRYQNGVILSYCLIAYSPWEGLRIAITGTKGRVELDVIESAGGLSGQSKNRDIGASKGPFKKTEIRVYPMFGTGHIVEIPKAAGGHGGADPMLLEQIFAPNPPDDPYHRTASHIDGAASIMLGIAANQSMATRQPVHINDLFPLPQKT